MATPLNSFLAAQSADPLDPVPMLVWADHLEEHGDATAAEVLRGLVGAGVPSLVALAGAACRLGAPLSPDGEEDEGDLRLWLGDAFGQGEAVEFGFGDPDFFGGESFGDGNGSVDE